MNPATAQTGSLFMQQSAPSRRLLAYGAAVVLPVLTLLLRLALWRYLPGYPFLAFVPSVAFVALVGGVPPGVLAAMISALLGLAFLTDRPGFASDSQLVWSGLFFYGIVCTILIVLTHRTTKATALAMDAVAAQAAARESTLQARLEVDAAAAARIQVERRLEQVTDALPVLISQVGRDLCFRFANRAYAEWFGRSREDLIGQHVQQVVGPEVFARARPHIDRVLSGHPTTFEAKIPHGSGGLRDVRAHYVPNIDCEGEVEGYYALVQDITDMKHQADLLAQRERHLQAVMESVTDCFYALDKDWCITLFNRAAERYYGMGREEVLGRKLWEVFPAHLGSMFEEQLQQVMTERVPVTFEARSVVFPGRYIEMRVSPKENGGLAVSFSDITARKREEHQRELLINELNHRVKNTLAVVQSMAAQSLRDPRVPREARNGFESRLVALAAAHDLLTQESWESAQLRTVIEAALRPFDLEHRFELSGPDLRVRPQTAVNLTLGLHELATNAIKYGALSNKVGSVRVTWSVSKGELPMFRLVWQERGGPAVAPPERSGFGSRLIQKGLSGELGGPVTLDFAPRGLTCTIEVPVANLEAR